MERFKKVFNPLVILLGDEIPEYLTRRSKEIPTVSMGIVGGIIIE